MANKRVSEAVFYFDFTSISDRQKHCPTRDVHIIRLRLNTLKLVGANRGEALQSEAGLAIHQYSDNHG